MYINKNEMEMKEIQNADDTPIFIIREIFEHLFEGIICWSRCLSIALKTPATIYTTQFDPNPTLLGWVFLVFGWVFVVIGSSCYQVFAKIRAEGGKESSVVISVPDRFEPLLLNSCRPIRPILADCLHRSIPKWLKRRPEPSRKRAHYAATAEGYWNLWNAENVYMR